MDAMPVEHATAGLTAVDLRAYADHASKMRESADIADIAEIAPALVRAQAAMENPPRNRSVQVRTQAGTYTFRYATLDKITEITRRALAENGLCVLQPIVSTEKGPALVTRLLHESGRWMECEISMPPLGSNPQSFGSAVTYLRRYSVSSMLNLAADEDNDGNGAAGNHATGVTRKDRHRDRAAAGAADASPAASPEVAARALADRARSAEGVGDGHALLEAWRRDAEALETLRGGKAWEALERELWQALKRTLGADPAAAFIGALRASDARQASAMQQSWTGRWADALSAMQQEAPATHALLREIFAAQTGRAKAASPTPSAPDTADTGPTG